MHKRNLFPLLAFIFLVICKGSPLQSNASISLTNNPLKTFISEIGSFKIALSQHPRLNGMTEHLNRVEDFMANLSKTAGATNNAVEILLTTVSLLLEKYQDIEKLDPIRAQEEIQDRLKKLVERIGEMKNNSEDYWKERKNFDFSQISDGAGKLFAELSLKISELQNDHTACSTQLTSLAGDLSKAQQQNNLTLERLQNIEERIQTKKRQIENNYREIDHLRDQMREDLNKIKNEAKKIENSYEEDFLNQKSEAIEACRKKIQKIDEKLSELETQIGEFGTALINHFIIVVDHSGSMQGEKWREVLNALEYFMKANQHQASHTLSIIPFETSAYMHLKAQRFFEYTAPENFPWGLTNFDAAAEAIRDTIPLSKSRPIVLFLTDGVPTTCDKTYNILSDIHAKYGKSGLLFFGLGVGDFDYEVLSQLTKIANAGNEYFAHEKGKIEFIHTTRDEKILHKIFLEVSAIVKKSGEEIDREIAWLRNQKKIEIQEQGDLISALEEFYLQSTGENSISNKKEQSVSQEFERKKSKLEEQNDKLHSEIDSLNSQKEEMSISPTHLNDLLQRHARQHQTCTEISTKISEVKAQRDLEEDKSLDIGVRTQRELIKKSEQFLESEEKFLNFVQSYIEYIEVQIQKVEGCLQINSFNQLKNHTKEKADLIFGKFLKMPQNSCQGVYECLQTAFASRYKNRPLDSQLPLSTLLAIIAGHFKSISPLLSDQIQSQSLKDLPELQDALRKALYAKKEATWSIPNTLNQVTRILFDVHRSSLIHLGQEEIGDEVKTLEMLVNWIIKDLNDEYQMFLHKTWKESLSDINKTLKETLLAAHNKTELS